MSSIYRHRWLPIAFSAALFYALMAVVTSTLSDEVSSSELTFLRLSGSTILMFIVVIHNGSSLVMKDRRELAFHLVMSMFTVSTTYCQVYAFTHMAPADASAIVYGYVALTGLIARIVLKEPFGIFEVSMVVLTFTGTLLIARPSFLFHDSGGISARSRGYVPPLVAFAAAVLSAAKAVTVRAMSKQDTDLMRIIIYPMIFSAIIIAIPTTVFQEWSIPTCTWVRLRVFLFVVFAFVANFLSIYAFTLQNAVYVSLILLNDSVLVLIITMICFSYMPNWTSAIGIFLIMGSAVAIAVRKIMAHRKREVINQTKVEDDVTMGDPPSESPPLPNEAVDQAGSCPL